MFLVWSGSGIRLSSMVYYYCWENLDTKYVLIIFEWLVFVNIGAATAYRMGGI